MFDKLIDSAPGRRKRRFLGFFFGTSILYLLALAAALVISVLIANPEMAHTSDLKITNLVHPPKRGNPDTPPAKEQAKPSQPDIYHPAPIDVPIEKLAAEQTTTRSNNPPTSDLIPGL